METEEILDKMREIKLAETANLIEKKLGNNFTTEQFYEALKTNYIKDIEFLGKFYINGEMKDIYKIIEQEQQKDGKTIKYIEKYVTEELKTIAGKIKGEMLPTEGYKNNQVEFKKIRDEEKKGDNIKLNKLEDERKEKFNIKEEIPLNQIVDGNSTLEEKLKLKERGIKDAKKLARVSTNELSQKTSQIDGFVVITKSGKIIELGEDILKADSKVGTNPRDENLTINNDGTVQKEVVTTRYNIVGTKDYISVGNDETLGKEIKYSKYSNQKNEYLDAELKSQTTIQANNVRQFIKDRSNGINKPTEAINQMEETGETKNVVENIDANQNNDKEPNNEEGYIPETNYTWKQLANAIGNRTGNYIRETKKEFLKTKNESNNRLTNQQTINLMIERAEEQYRGSKNENAG